MKNIVKTFKFIIKEFSFALFLAIIGGIIASLSSFIPLIFGEQILNILVDVYGGNTSIEFMDIFILAIIMIILIFLINVINGVINVIFSEITESTYIYSRYLIGRKALTLDYLILEDKSIKDSIESTFNSQNYYGGFGSILWDLFMAIKALCSLIISSIYISRLFITNPNIENSNSLISFLNNSLSGLIVLGTIILVVIISFVIAKTMVKIQEKIFNKMIDCNHKFGYLFSLNVNYKLLKDLKIYNMDEIVLKEMGNANKFISIFFKELCLKQGYMMLSITLINIITLFISYSYVAMKAYYGIIPIGNIISVVGSISIFISCDLFFKIGEIGTRCIYSSYYYDFMNIKNEESEELVDINEVKAPFTFEFKNVSFKYPNSEEYALKNVSFILGDVDKTAIVGKNGAGKSTIIKLVSRFYHPESGEILVNGIKIDRFNFKDYQKLFAVVFQDFSLFPYSLKENVVGSKGVKIDEISSILDGVDFNYKKFDKGLDLIVSNQIDTGVELSGGEAQKVAIARAIYKDSPYVLLDEPTSALDPISEAEIYALFDKLVENKKAVYISHRMSSTRFCNKIIVLDKGEIVESGTHEELMKVENGIYKHLFNTQAQYYKETL